jgi:CP family cyanate transporter-like MFS transporter
MNWLRNPAWVVILAGISAALHVGKLPPALPVLRDALGISLVQSGFLLSMVQLAGMTLGLAVGLTADGRGLKHSLLTGLLLLAGAGAWGGWATDASSLIALRALEGLGFLLVAMPAPSLLRQLVPPQRLYNTLGIWSTYMPVGTALALLTGPFFMAWAGWQMWWWCTAGVSLLMALWVWRVVPSDTVRRAQGLAATGQGAVPSALQPWPDAWPQRLRQTLRAPGPWLVALSFAVYSSQWLAVIGFLPSMYAQAGMQGNTSAVLTALAALSNLVGNLASGRWLQRGVPAQRLLYLGFIGMTLGAFVAFAAWPALSDTAGSPASLGDTSIFSPPWRFAAVLLFSAVGGIIPGTLFSLSVQLAPNERTVSTTVGFMQQWSAMGQFVGPPLVAWLASRAGHWHLTWWATWACSLAGLWLAQQVGRQLAAQAGRQSRHPSSL